MDFLGRQPVRVGFWAVLLVGVLAWAPATYPGYWQGLDGFIPSFNIVHSSPIAGVATNADLWRGTGNAAFILAQPLLLLGLTPTAAVRAVFVLCFVLGGLGIYAWMRPRFGDRTAGMAGVIYMFLPPVLATVYVRGSLSDAMILALLPLALAATAAYAGSGGLGAASLLVLSVLWMWRTQAGLALLATLVLLVYAVVVERHRLAVLAVGVAGAAGLVSLVPLRSIQSDTPVHFTDHFVAFYQLFARSWTVAPSIPGWQDQYPFQLGLVAVAFTVMAGWLIATGYAPEPNVTRFRRDFWFAVGVTVVLTALTLGWSRWLWTATHAQRLLTYPWQVLLPAMPFLALSAAMLVYTNPVLRRAPLWPLLLTITVLGSYAYLTADFTQVEPPARPPAVFGDANNLALLQAELHEDREAGQATLDVTWQTLQALPVDYNVFFQALTDPRDGPAVIAQLDMPAAGAERPATTWRPGTIMQQSYTLSLPPLSEYGEPLTYYFGYYDWRDGARLPVDGGIDDKLVFYGR